MDMKSSRVLNNPNKAMIFKSLIVRGPMSRIELSKNLPLSKMSVTNYVNELIADGLIHETGTVVSEAGRKPMLLDVSTSRPLFVSLQITRFYISVGIADCKGNFQNINMAPTDNSDTVSSVTSKIIMLLDQALTPDILPDTWAIGASSMGPVSCAEGVLYANERPALNEKIEIRKILEQKYALPVYVNNDLNVLAFAEKYFGNAVDYDNFSVVGSSIGLGCSVMIKGEIFSGHDGLGSELGHVCVEVNGKPCYCGNTGCLEQYASIPATVEWVQNAHKKAGLACEFNNWQDFICGVQSNNEICRKGFDRLITYLGTGLVNLVNLFNPGCIFLGEYYAQAAPLMSEPLSRFIQAHQFFPQQIVTEVKGSRFMGVSPLIGPAVFAMHMSLNPQ